MENRYGTISLDDSLEAIADETRRSLLLELREHERLDERTLDSRVLADDATAGEIRVQLRHVHLPKLESYGIVEWFPERNEIRRDAAYEEIEPLLSLLDDHSDQLPGEWP